MFENPKILHKGFYSFFQESCLTKLYWPCLTPSFTSPHVCLTRNLPTDGVSGNKTWPFLRARIGRKCWICGTNSEKSPHFRRCWGALFHSSLAPFHLFTRANGIRVFRWSSCFWSSSFGNRWHEGVLHGQVPPSLNVQSRLIPKNRKKILVFGRRNFNLV